VQDLPDTVDDLEFRIIHDGPGPPYLSGDNIRYTRLFDHWTIGAARPGRVLRPYRLDFKALAAAADMADKVAGHGWEYAAFVAKLMTSSKSAAEAYEIWMKLPVDKRSEAPDSRRVAERPAGFQTTMFQAFPEASSEAAGEIRRVVKRHIDFETHLFVVKRTSRVHERSPKIPGLPDKEREYRVAGINSRGRRVLQRVLGNREESYYGYFGEYSRDGRLDPASLPQATWDGFSVIHAMLHQRTVNAIAAGGLDRAIAS
jgi:hypothetical protein